MAITNYERVGKAMELLKDGLSEFVIREFKTTYGDRAADEAVRVLGEDRGNARRETTEFDVAALLKLMWDGWNEVFRRTLGHTERSMVSELRDVRNRWAHQQAFSSDDAERALDTAERLLTAVSASQAEDVRKLRMELRRLTMDEQVRSERRKRAAVAVESTATSLTPWRDVVTPHRDVASGRYQQAEFAADLWQVHLGEGSDEYRDPVEFFRRTYLTDSLRGMLTGAVRRLSGQGGDPVVQLQTNFGGGKTHSMLALYHLFSGASSTSLHGIDEVMQEAGVKKLPVAKRVVLVGNKISPGNPSTKPDGTRVSTLWGELAWQLGGREAYERVRADDERATSPGDVLRELFNEYGPCLILVDEWVAYARQLHDQSDLPAGGFETQFTFAQVLTESAKLASNCLLVISLPASDTAGSPHSTADDVEVGGLRGREALDRLRNVIGRVESSWRPASAEEGFEIVRRRLFEPMTDPDQFRERDLVVQTFARYYERHKAEFPPDCSALDYQKRMQAAYPIHPEIFDRLYTDWSTLVKFQRTRGVLRLMAAVIHSLWESGDKNALIMPSLIPIDDNRVQFELTRYLTDNWVPVIEKDVDGSASLPAIIDGEQPGTLGKVSACRRVARTIYLGSAPLGQAAHRGLEDRRIKLGCVMPGETPAVFGDALRRLASAATYLYQDGARYWYSTQPTVTKLAEDRAEQLKGDPDKVAEALNELLRRHTSDKERADFARVHPLPASTGDVPDEPEARLVVLAPGAAHTRDANSEALAAARHFLENRGLTPRIYRNALVFLAPDKTSLASLEDAIRRQLAWRSIVDDRIALNLDPQQVKQAENQLASAEITVAARLPETYLWLLVPSQASAQSPVEIRAVRLSGQETLAARASKKLRNDEDLLLRMGGTSLALELNKVPLWRGDWVSIRQLADDFATYTYLPRLRDSDVLLGAIDSGLASLNWQQETFAYAESYDEASSRYLGLLCGQRVTLAGVDSAGILVKPEAAERQRQADAAVSDSRPAAAVDASAGSASPAGSGYPAAAAAGAPPAAVSQPQNTRFFASAPLDPARAGRDAARIAEEVIVHLAGLAAANVTVTLEIAADIPDGAPDNVVRTVTENCNTLKFRPNWYSGE